MKKLLVLILSVIAAFTAMLSLTACDNKPSGNGGATITDGDKSSDDNNGGSGSGSQGGNDGSSGSETGGEHGGSETGGLQGGESGGNQDDKGDGSGKYSKNLRYELNNDKTGYILTGIGLCEDTDIIIPPTYNNLPIVEIGELSFLSQKVTNITIPDNVKRVGYRAFSGCDGLNYNEYNGALYLGNTNNPYLVLSKTNSTKIKSLDISRKCNVIQGGAFMLCSSLTSVNIPDGVTSIGKIAFDGCSSLTSVTIPDSVTSIGDYAFAGCESLTNIDVNANNVNYKSIDGDLYSKDGKTLIQYAVGKTDTAFTIPDGVTNIGGWAFNYCSLITSITIPNSVTGIGDYAFFKCLSLSNITYKGSKEQWKAITKGTVWYTVNCIIHCINGDISIQD